MNTRYLRCSKCGKSDFPTNDQPGTSTLMRCPDCCKPYGSGDGERLSPPYADMCRDCCPTGHQTHGEVSKS